MARRTLSLQGRIAAAGVSVAVAGGLVGLMAAADHHTDAVATTSDPAASASQPGASAATPYQSHDDDGGVTGDAGFIPQPQTRTGGS
jgi:hypothetical protein